MPVIEVGDWQVITVWRRNEVVAWDGGGGRFLEPLISALKGKLSDCQDLDRDQALQVAQGAALIVAHASDEDWKELINRAADDAVCIRVASGGFRHKPSAPSREGSKLILYLMQPSGDLKEKDWCKIVSKLGKAHVRSALAEGWSNPLNAYFRCDSVDNLAAVALLCQAYLAVYAESQPDGAWGPPCLKEALLRMRWPEFLESESKSAKRIRCQLQNRQLRDKLRDQVGNPSWWRGVFAEPSEVVEACHREWCNIGGSQSWQEVRRLLELIVRQSQLPPPDRSERSHPVAEAFLAIVKLLNRP
jgi:hypothetical protein